VDHKKVYINDVINTFLSAMKILYFQCSDYTMYQVKFPESVDADCYLG